MVLIFRFKGIARPNAKVVVFNVPKDSEAVPLKHSTDCDVVATWRQCTFPDLDLFGCAQGTIVIRTSVDSTLDKAAEKAQPIIDAVLTRVRLEADDHFQLWNQMLHENETARNKTLLNNLDERTPDLVRSIRMKMFTFDDLATLDVKTMQKIMREVDAGKLAVALSAAPVELQDAMLGALSKRAAENVVDEIENMGKVSLREVETNQNSIIDVVRQLESEGEISLEAE